MSVANDFGDLLRGYAALPDKIKKVKHQRNNMARNEICTLLCTGATRE